MKKVGDREHPRLIELLEEATEDEGSQLALARKLGLLETEISGLINGRRFVTVRQALLIESVLKVSARDLWLEGCAARFDEAFEKVREGK